MPRMLTIEGKKRKVATEQELLDFANAIRQAGGANILEALLPSKPHDASGCLIANALNFSCEVDCPCIDEAFASGADRWFMFMPANIDIERVREIARNVPGVRLRHIGDAYGEERRLALSLPEHIGNAARAFDEGEAFQNYVVK